MLSLVVQKVSPAGCDVNCCAVLGWAFEQGLVILGWILDYPSVQIQFKQQMLKLFVWMRLPVSVCSRHLAKIDGIQPLRFSFSTVPNDPVEEPFIKCSGQGLRLLASKVTGDATHHNCG